MLIIAENWERSNGRSRVRGPWVSGQLWAYSHPSMLFLKTGSFLSFKSGPLFGVHNEEVGVSSKCATYMLFCHEMKYSDLSIICLASYCICQIRTQNVSAIFHRSRVRGASQNLTALLDPLSSKISNPWRAISKFHIPQNFAFHFLHVPYISLAASPAAELGVFK